MDQGSVTEQAWWQAWYRSLRKRWYANLTRP